MSTVTVKRGDVGRSFTDTLTEGGSPADLSTATEVLFVLRRADALAPAVASAAAILDVDAGTVEYVTADGDLDIAGDYLQEWQVTYADASIATFPDEGYNRVLVEPDLDQTEEAVDVTGTCAQWITWTDMPCDVDLSALPGSEATWQQLVLATASNALYERSGRQFGLCSETARPVPCCRRHWRHSGRPCSCGRYEAIRLGDAPIAAITEVTIDGAVLDSSAYRVDEYQWLVRVDGDRWPTCNDLSVDSDEAGTFEVTWQYGFAVPPEGLLAARLYACKLAKDLAGQCSQPSGREESINRDGVTINLRPPKPGELLGIDFVDGWLAQFNITGGIFDPARKREVWRTDT